jgi:hypothetical protein
VTGSQVTLKDDFLAVMYTDGAPTGVMQPEECLCRRSNLHATLTTPNEQSTIENNYPIPSKSGIYSDTVGKPYFFHIAWA